MYIYELPFDINRDLCRLLDNDDDWKELAGVHMKYSPFDVNEIEQESRRQILSPTNQLFIRWGQQNHRVEELFILLYRMKHVPAMKTLMPVVDGRFHRLMVKHSSGRTDSKEKETATVDENANKPKQKLDGSESSLPLPVMLIENGVQMPTSSNAVNVISGTDGSSSENNSLSSNGMFPQDLHAELLKNVSAIPMIKYKDLKEATDNWSEDNLLGKGGFGNVYKGIWTLLPVAVKRLRDVDNGKNLELIRELCLNQYRHDNILPLYGYSIGGPETCLVYQLMAGGSLEQRLRGKTQHAPLTWSKRYRIAHGVSRGLQYLHTMAGAPLIHGDIKPANILLDQCTVPKIGDFGLARKGPYGEDKTHMKVSRPQGTRPYLPHEYLTSRCLSPAVDVFSFGVVLAELATCLPAWDRARKQPFLSEFIAELARNGVDYASFEDRILQGTQESNPSLCRAFMALAVECTHVTRQQRPSMLLTYRRIDAMHCVGDDDMVPRDMR